MTHQHISRSTSRFSQYTKILFAVPLAVLLILVGIHIHYTDRAFPGTTVANIDVSGLNVQQIEQQLTQSISERDYIFTINGEHYSATTKQIGITIDAHQTAMNVVHSSRSWFFPLTFLNPTQHSLTYSWNISQFHTFADSLAATQGNAAQPAGIHLTKEGHFITTPESNGKSLDLAHLKKSIESALTTLTPSPIPVTITDTIPTIRLKDAEAALPQVEKLSVLPITIHAHDRQFTATQGEQADWIIVPLNVERTQLTAPTFDREKLHKWVQEKAFLAGTDTIDHFINTDANGKILYESKLPTRDGQRVTNTEEIVNSIIESATNGTPYSGSFTFETIPSRNITQTAIPTNQPTLFPAAEGQKWLEIDLKTNTYSAYEGLKRVHGPVDMVPGKPGYETITGTYQIYLKHEKQDMGCTPDWPYCAKNVPWVLYFHESYGFHGAPWQERFGWSGPDASHGCVNLPVPESYWLYNWAPLGTPVVSHN